MNKFSLALLLIVALVFASNFKQHFVQIKNADEKVQLLMQSNQKKLDALNTKPQLSKHELWLQQHLSKNLNKTDLLIQGSQLTNYSLLSMIAIMLACAVAFMFARRKDSRLQTVDITCPAPSDNPVVQRVSWQMMGSIAANFNSNRIKRKSEHKLRILSSPQWIIFSSAFALLGLNAFGFALYKSYITGSDWSPGLGIVFIASGTGLLVYGFLQGWLIDRQLSLASSPLNGQHDIREVVALQFITGISGARRRIFNVYEINLILKDAQRISLSRYGEHSNAMHSAAILAKFLNVPVWRD